MDQTLQIVGDILVIAAFMACLTFVLCYNHFADWRHSRRGNHLIRFMQVATAALFLGVVRVFWPDIPFFLYFRIVIFSLINWVLWWRVAILFEEQEIIKIRRTRKQQKNYDDREKDISR